MELDLKKKLMLTVIASVMADGMLSQVYVCESNFCHRRLCNG